MNRRTPMLGGRIRGQINATGIVLRHWWQFVGIVTELEQNRNVLEDLKRLEINTEPDELSRFNVSIGDRVGILMGDNDNLYLHLFPRLNSVRQREGIF